MTTENIPTITIGDETIKVTDLPKNIQELISMYLEWEGNLREEQKAVFKTQQAIKSLSTQIEGLFIAWKVEKERMAVDVKAAQSVPTGSAGPQ